MADFNKYYRAYLLMQETLRGDFTHNYISGHLADANDGKDVLSGKNYRRVIDMDWVEAIEDAIPYIDKAIREQRRFIIQNEDIVPIEKARKITNESVRHLAQHTNLIARVEGDNVTPERILDIQREESFAIYENRFLRTLLLNVSRFVDERYKAMKEAPNDSYHKVQISRSITLNEQKLDFELSYANESHESSDFDINADVSTLSDYQRILRLRRVMGDFSASPLIRDLASAELVRPPIQRTNLMTKNPNFKKALDLWLFVESYTKTGFDIVGEEYSGAMTEGVQSALYNVMSYEHFVLSIATNPALEKMLHEKYLEENARLEKESLRPEEQIILETEAKIAKVREEETQIRLEEIRSREKQITELNSQLNHAKFTLRQYETKMTEMKGLINLHETTIQKLKDEIFELEKEKKTLVEKLEELAAIAKEQKVTIDEQANQIKALQSAIAAKDAEISKHLDTISQLQHTVADLKTEISTLKAENTALSAKLADANNSIASLTAEVEKLRDTVYKNAEELGILKNTLAERDSEIESKNKTLNEVRQKLTEAEASLAATILQHSNEKNALIKAHTDEKQALSDDFTRQYEAIKAEKDAELNNVKSDYENKITEINSRHVTELDALQKVSDLRLRQQKEASERETAKLIEAEKNASASAISKASKEFEKKLDAANKRAKQELSKAVKQAENDAKSKYDEKLKSSKAQQKLDKSNSKFVEKMFGGFLPGCSGFAAVESEGCCLISSSHSPNKIKKSFASLLDSVEAELDDSKRKLMSAHKAFVLVECQGVSAELKERLYNKLKGEFGFENPIFIDASLSKRNSDTGKLVLYYLKK